MVFFDIKNNIIEDKEGEVAEIRTVPFIPLLFDEGIVKDKTKRNKIAKEAIERYGYTQKEVADFIGIHYSVVSRLLKSS